MNRLLAYVMSVFGVCLWSFAANAASFDCHKAQTKVEKTICNNTELSKLDEDLAQQYKQQLTDTTNNPQDIRQDQRLWLTFQRNTCPDEMCLIREYKERLQQGFVDGANIYTEHDMGYHHFPQNNAFGTFVESATIFLYNPDTRKHDAVNQRNQLQILEIPGEPVLAIVNSQLLFNNGHTCDIEMQEAMWSQNHWVLNAKGDGSIELRLYPAIQQGKSKLLLRDIEGNYRRLSCGMQGYYDGLVFEKE